MPILSLDMDCDLLEAEVRRLAASVLTNASILVLPSAPVSICEGGAFVEAWTCVGTLTAPVREAKRKLLVQEARLRSGFSNDVIEDEANTREIDGFDYVQTIIYVCI